MSEWIGEGGSLCIAYRETSVTARTLAIQLPDFPDNCGFATKDLARAHVLAELLNMCYTNLIVDKDDSLVSAAAAAGWPLDRLVIRMNGVGVIREQYRWSAEEGRPLYPMYYECGLVYVPECGWFQITELGAPDYEAMGEAASVSLATRYQIIESGLRNILKGLNCVADTRIENVRKIENPEDLVPCFERLTTMWLAHLMEISSMYPSSSGTQWHPYAIYFDEPQKTGTKEVVKLELAALLRVIRGGITAGNPLYMGGQPLFTVIANFDVSWGPDHMNEWKPYADFIFPDYYRHGYSATGLADYDQRDLWQEDKSQYGGRMNGAFISILEDHVRQLRGRDFRPTEVPGLFSKAIELGLDHLWVFPGSEAQWRDIEKLFKKTRCELFLDYAREICELQSAAGWIRDGRTSKTKVYCSYFPQCSKCQGYPPESSVWTTIRPNNFPDENELLDPFGIRIRIRMTDLPEDIMKATRDVASTRRE
ncbi:MAG TPA: hypothetical protein PK916_16295 [Bacteroidota bacterium]|nr:hypothetical protein [Bacteroidota bacterium]